MANLNFSELSIYLQPTKRRDFFRLGVVLGLGLVMPGSLSIQPAHAQTPENISFIKEPIIVGDRVVGVGDVGGRLALLEGAPGEDNTFYFIEKGGIDDENIHYLAVDPKNNNRIAMLGDSGFLFSDNNWQTHANFGNPETALHGVESVRFSDDGSLVFMDIEREGQKNTVVFNPDSIPNYQTLEGNFLAGVSSQPSTPRFQADGTYIDFRLTREGNSWILKRNTYDLRSRIERSENTIQRFRAIEEKPTRLIGEFIDRQGDLNLIITMSQLLMHEAGSIETSVWYEVDPRKTVHEDSASPIYGYYPIDISAPIAELLITGGVKDLKNGGKYLSIFYNGLNQNSEPIQGYGIEFATDLSPQYGGRVRWPETDPIDYLGILYAVEDIQYLVALTDGKLKTLRMGATTREEWKQALLQQN